MMSGKEIKYENRLVAFIDILGFKDLIAESENNADKIESIYSILDYLKNWEIPENWDSKIVEIEEYAQKRGVDRFQIKDKTNTTAFSDSIVVSVKITNEDDIGGLTSTLIANLAYIGATLLEKGILFRGGLTIGNIVHESSGTVFGQGLVDAYKLECGCAKFPRIILSNELIRKLNYPILTKKSGYPYHQYISRFEDGCVGFTQLIYYQLIQSHSEITTKFLINSLDKVRKIIIEGLDSNFERPEVFEKYKWLKEQYNILAILEDNYDDNNIPIEKIKIKIHELNEDIPGNNIHYQYTDAFYENIRNDKIKEV